MSRTTKPLTNTEVKQAKPKEKEYNLADGGGLYLRVHPNGHKSWLFNYSRPFTKKRTNISIGEFPNVSLARAREYRQDFLALLADNTDPKEHRKQLELAGRVAHENTFEVVYRKWLKVKEADWSESYRDRLTQAMELHILPALGPVPISKINAPDTIRLLEPLAERKALETVRKLCRWINEVMILGVNSGLIPANPLAGIRKAFQKPESTNMPTIKPGELPGLLSEIEKSGNDLTVRCQFYWLMYTMVRPGEGAQASWDEIDLEERTWTIPAERMKMRRPHVVPLSDQAMEILEIMRPISRHREYVFPSRNKPRESINSESVNMMLKRLGYKGKLVSHGIRSLTSTILNEHEFPHDVIETALAHVDTNKIRATYNRAEYLEQRRKMMQWLGNYIEEAATGKEPNKSKKHLKVV